jgi:hypothetical protein
MAGQAAKAMMAATAAPTPDFRKNMMRPRKYQAVESPALFQILGGDLEGLSP